MITKEGKVSFFPTPLVQFYSLPPIYPASCTSPCPGPAPIHASSSTTSPSLISSSYAVPLISQTMPVPVTPLSRPHLPFTPILCFSRSPSDLSSSWFRTYPLNLPNCAVPLFPVLLPFLIILFKLLSPLPPFQPLYSDRVKQWETGIGMVHGRLLTIYRVPASQDSI